MAARLPTLRVAALLLAGTACAAGAQVSTIAADEDVVLFPTYAHRVGPEVWRVRVRGWVFEPEHDSVVRRRVLARAVDALAVKPADEPLFGARLRPFLVDNERRELVVVALGEVRATMAESGPDGHFDGALEVDDETMRRLRAAGGPVLALRVVLPAGERRVFVGRVHPIEPRGLTVVSDVDDTVRLASGDDVRARVRDALIGDYAAVPDVAQAYRDLAERGAAFHWLTAAPWQLHAAYDEFLQRAGFPAGSLHMRKFRLKDRSVLELLRGPRAHKEGVLDELLADFPRRRFVLIGDTVEEDPEVFGAIARRHSEQVVRVLLRAVGEVDGARLQAAFAGCREGLWSLFRTGEELQKTTANIQLPPKERTGWR